MLDKPKNLLYNVNVNKQNIKKRKDVFTMTKRENYEALKAIEAVASNEELVAFIDHEIELLNKKSSKSGKPTARQVENVEIAEVVAEVLADGVPVTVTELLAKDERFEGLTNQRMSAILRGMGERVVKTTEKKVSRFTLA